MCMLGVISYTRTSIQSPAQNNTLPVFGEDFFVGPQDLEAPSCYETNLLFETFDADQRSIIDFRIDSVDRSDESFDFESVDGRGLLGPFGSMDLSRRCHYNYNWLMYLNFVRQDQEAVQTLYNQLPEERRDEQMYKTVQGLSSKLQGNLQEAHSQLIEAIHYNTVPLEDVSSSLETTDSGNNNAASDKDGDATDFSSNVFAQYLAVEDMAALALHGQFHAALASYKRLSNRFSAPSSSLWKLPFFNTFVLEQKLQNTHATLPSESQQQYRESLASLQAELLGLTSYCNEDAVYQSLARLSTKLSAAKSTEILPSDAAAEKSVTAAEIIEQALEKHPANVDLLDILIRSYLTDDSFDAVLRTLQAQQSSNMLKHSLNIDFAYIAGLAGDMDTSLTRAKLAACQSAYSSSAWNNIAVSLIERRKHVTGIGSMRFSRSLDVTNWIISHNLGFVHLKMGLYASAVIFLTAAYRYGGAQNAATVFLLSVCVSELGNASLAKKLLLNASRVVKQNDVAVLVFLIPALIEVGEYSIAMELYSRFADMVKFMRGDTIRHQQMRRAELSQQLDYFATHIPDIVQLLTFMQQQQEQLPTSAATAKLQQQQRKSLTPQLQNEEEKSTDEDAENETDE